METFICGMHYKNVSMICLYILAQGPWNAASRDAPHYHPPLPEIGLKKKSAPKKSSRSDRSLMAS